MGDYEEKAAKAFWTVCWFCRPWVDLPSILHFLVWLAGFALAKLKSVDDYEAKVDLTVCWLCRPGVDLPNILHFLPWLADCALTN